MAKSREVLCFAIMCYSSCFAALFFPQYQLSRVGCCYSLVFGSTVRCSLLLLATFYSTARTVLLCDRTVICYLNSFTVLPSRFATPNFL